MAKYSISNFVRRRGGYPLSQGAALPAYFVHFTIAMLLYQAIDISHAMFCTSLRKRKAWWKIPGIFSASSQQKWQGRFSEFLFNNYWYVPKNAPSNPMILRFRSLNLMNRKLENSFAFSSSRPRISRIWSLCSLVSKGCSTRDIDTSA